MSAGHRTTRKHRRKSKAFRSRSAPAVPTACSTGWNSMSRAKRALMRVGARRHGGGGTAPCGTAQRQPPNRQRQSKRPIAPRATMQRRPTRRTRCGCWTKRSGGNATGWQASRRPIFHWSAKALASKPTGLEWRSLSSNPCPMRLHDPAPFPHPTPLPRRRHSSCQRPMRRSRETRKTRRPQQVPRRTSLPPPTARPTSTHQRRTRRPRARKPGTGRPSIRKPRPCKPGAPNTHRRLPIERPHAPSRRSPAWNPVPQRAGPIRLGPSFDPNPNPERTHRASLP